MPILLPFRAVWQVFGQWLSTPRAIAITIPLMVLGTGLLVALSGRSALNNTVDIFAATRIDDHAEAMVARLDQNLADIDPILAGLATTIDEDQNTLERAFAASLIERPWLRWIAIQGLAADATLVAPGPDATSQVTRWPATGPANRHTRTARGATSSAVPTTLPDTLPSVTDTTRSAWWQPIMIHPTSGDPVIVRARRFSVAGREVLLSAAVDLRRLPSLQAKELTTEGLRSIALLDDHDHVLLERTDRDPDTPQTLTLKNSAMEAARKLLTPDVDRSSKVIDIDGTTVRILARRLPSQTGPSLAAIAVADETRLREPAGTYLLRSVLIKVVATSLALALALLYALRILTSHRQLEAERHRAEQAEQRADEFGAYRLTRMVGRGGMGEVWAAEHRLLARPTAIKLLSVRNDGPALDRFVREARMTAALRCPHTVQLYDYGTSIDGQAYYAMELLDGVDLERLVERHGPLPPERVVAILIQICESLAEAHDLGLVHRDIKPSNILLCRVADRCDFVKVLDFGIVAVSGAGAEQGTTEQPLLTAGTPGYMAPEQAAGQALDGRADLYALGCVAWWLLFGRPVFDTAKDTHTLLSLHASAPLPSPSSQYRPPVVLFDLIKRCLAKKVAQRPKSARALGRALSACHHVMPEWDNDIAARWWQQHHSSSAAHTIPGAACLLEPATHRGDTTHTLEATSFERNHHQGSSRLMT
ncbi:MAG: serine/threonine-protein kinase [Planctomycetota bacterium]|jgi:serine/threonine protein kinase|nr:serine/threonine-protein kinase [Planctomycetota bacterium]